MTDDLPEKVAVALVSTIFKESVLGVRLFSKMISSKAREADILGIAARAYCESMRRRYDVVRIFAMSQPLALSLIYTRVRILRRITARRNTSIDELDRARRQRKRFAEIPDSETRDGHDIVDSLDRIVLLGKPGSGKTTFLRHVVLESMDENTFSKKLVPIYVSLKALSDSTISLEQFVVTEFENCGLEDPGAFVRNLLTQGKCRVLLDGLDEVSNVRRDEIIKAISDLSERCPGNQFIMTCRVSAYFGELEKFTDTEMADFSDDQIRTFVRNWFAKSSAGLDAACLSKIRGTPGLRELATTPLLLAMLCLAFEDDLDISANRAELYGQAIEALLRRWDASRRIHRGGTYQQLSIKRKEDLFAEIAADAFDQELYFFPRDLLERRITQFLQQLPHIAHADLRDESHGTLEAMKAHHGIIVERAFDIHSFSHLTLQEYFTARYIRERADSQRNLIRQHMHETRWREVIVLVACLLADADDFVICMLEAMVKIGFDNVPLSRLVAHRRKKSVGSERSPLSNQKDLPIRLIGGARHLGLVIDDLPARMRHAAELLSGFESEHGPASPVWQEIQCQTAEKLLMSSGGWGNAMPKLDEVPTIVDFKAAATDLLVGAVHAASTTVREVHDLRLDSELLGLQREYEMQKLEEEIASRTKQQRGDYVSTARTLLLKWVEEVRRELFLSGALQESGKRLLDTLLCQARYSVQMESFERGIRLLGGPTLQPLPQDIATASDREVASILASRVTNVCRFIHPSALSANEDDFESQVAWVRNRRGVVQVRACSLVMEVLRSPVRLSKETSAAAIETVLTITKISREDPDPDGADGPRLA